MDEQRLNAYIQLIQELLDCPNEEKAAILSANPELIDADLVQVMQAEAEKMAEGGQGNANWLRSFAQKIESANYSLPTLQKAEANRLFEQGIQQYQHSQFRQALQSWQQCLDLYREIGDRRGEGRALGNLGVAYSDLGQVQRAIDYNQQHLAIAREIGDRPGEGRALGNLGVAYSDLGQVQRAIDYHQQHLAIAREIGDRPGEGSALGNLGNAYHNLGQVQRAIEYYEQDLAIAREIGDRRGEGGTLGNLGNAYADLGQVQRAIEFYEQCLAIAREVGDLPGEGTALGNLGSAYRELGQVQRAIEFYKQHLAIAREVGDLRGEGTALVNLGNAYRELGQVQRAIELYQQVLDIFREVGDRRGEGRALGNLGLAYSNLGQVQQAIELYQQDLAIALEVGDLPEKGRALGHLGLAYYSLGQVQRAIDFYQQVLDIFRQVGDRRGEGRTLGNLGIAYLSLGQVQRAIDFYEQDLAIAREIGDRPGEGNALGNLGTAYSSLGHVQQAIEYSEQHLDIAREIGDRAQEGNALGNLGNAYSSLGQVQQAIDYYEQDLAIFREIGDRTGEGRTLGNLGSAYYSLGQVQQAIDYYEQRLAIAREIGDRAGEGRTLGNLGLAYEELEQIPEAIAALKAGLQASSPAELPVEALKLGRNLGNTAFDSQNWETAIEGYDAAIEAVETGCSFEASYTEKQKRREAEIEVYEKLVQACINIGDIGKALASVERCKSRNLIELLVNSNLEPTGDVPPEMLQQLDTLRREVTAKQRFLETLDSPTQINSPSDSDLGQGRSSRGLSLDAINNIRQEYLKAKQELNKVLDTLKAYDPNFSLTQRVEPIKYTDIQGLLDEQTVLIEWYLTRDRIYAFVVNGGLSENGGISVWLSTPEEYSQLQKLRQTYFQTYSQNKSNWESQLDDFLHSLSDILHISELIAKIPDSYRQLILVPYRDLHLFPLHALPIKSGQPRGEGQPRGDCPYGDERQYLADRFADGVKYAPSCQFFQVSLRNRKDANPTTAKRFFAIQNPTEDLKSADLEVEAIADYFPSTARILVRKQASKTALNEKDTARDFRATEYFHFAGHGTFNFASPLLSHLVLAGASVNASQNDAETLPRSDDFTAEFTANTRFMPWREGKNIDLSKCYTLGELFELKLPFCRLVILSACETGLIDLSPDLEEYISLGLGFLYAGATNVICSLWAVNDLSTAILMMKLYEAMQNQLAVSLALKQAQQWMRNVTKQQLIEWFDLSPFPKSLTETLYAELDLGLEADDDRLFDISDWAAFCAIGI